MPTKGAGEHVDSGVRPTPGAATSAAPDALSKSSPVTFSRCCARGRAHSGHDCEGRGVRRGSADWQSAVSPNGIRRGGEFAVRLRIGDVLRIAHQRRPRR